MNYEIPGKELAIFHLAFSAKTKPLVALPIIKECIEEKISKIDNNEKPWALYVIIKQLDINLNEVKSVALEIPEIKEEKIYAAR